MALSASTRRKFFGQIGRAGLAVAANGIPLATTFAASQDGAQSSKSTSKLVGMYVHQHWPYKHPYAARTWTVDDWRGYAGALHRLGYNAVLIWPVLETMPDLSTPSDVANLRKIAQVIDLLHDDFGMKAYVVLCPNVVANDAEAAKAPFERRHFFYCDERVNPGDPSAVKRMMARRATLLAYLAKMDGMAIIDSDPGGYPGSSNQEFVDLLCAHRQLLDTLRPGIELLYWMHAGWQGYGRFYKTGVLTFSTEDENLDMLRRLKERNPEPWGLANGLQYASKLGVSDRVINFNYGRIENEPSFPMTNFGGNNAFEGGAAPSMRGVMGNSQTHCVQLPNTFAFACGATGKATAQVDYIAFANELIPGVGEAIARAWQAMPSTEPTTIRASIAELTAIPDKSFDATGPLRGLLFGDPRRFINDLLMMLRVRAGFEELRIAVNANTDNKKALNEFLAATHMWQTQHGYENSWVWQNLDEVLRKLNVAEVNQVLDNRFNPFAPPKLQANEAPFQYVARKLREEESFTPRLLKALETAQTKAS